MIFQVTAQLRHVVAVTQAAGEKGKLVPVLSVLERIPERGAKEPEQQQDNKENPEQALGTLRKEEIPAQGPADKKTRGRKRHEERQAEDGDKCSA